MKEVNFRVAALAAYIWSFFEQLGRRASGLVTTLVLTALIAPEEYAIIAVCSLLIALGNIISDAGMRVALIKSEKIEANDYSVAFTVNILIACCYVLVAYLSAGAVSNLFGVSSGSLLIQVATVAVIANAIGYSSVANLQRNLKFKLTGVAGLVSAVSSAASAICLAVWFDFGVWAIVFQIISQALIYNVLCFYFSLDRPVFRWNIARFIELFKTSYKVQISNFLNIFTEQFNAPLVSAFLSASLSGVYFLATRVRDVIVGQLFTTLQQVLFPLFSSMHRDKKDILSAYRKLLVLSVNIIVPAFTILAFVLPLLLTSVLNENWAGIRSILSILILAAVLYPIHSINLNALKIHGDGSEFLEIEVFKKFLFFPISIIAIQFGVIALAWSELIFSLVCFFVNTKYSAKIMGIGRIEQLSIFFKSVFITLIAFLVSYVIFSGLDNLVVSTVLIITTFMLLYSILLWGFDRASFSLLFYEICHLVRRGKV